MKVLQRAIWAGSKLGWLKAKGGLQRAFIATLAGGPMLATPATADLAHFTHAFNEACFQSLPNLDFVMQELQSPEWQRTQGADSGEFEFYASGTRVFLAMDGQSPGCAVMDDSVSKAQAEALLEDALKTFLANNSPSLWTRGFDQNGQAVWTLHMEDLVSGTGPINFYIDDGLGGGAAITIMLN